MARDFAKSRRQGAASKAPAHTKSPPRRGTGTSRSASPRTENPQPGSPWRWYLAGVMTGVFLSLLLYLGSLPRGADGAGILSGETATAEETPRPRFDFYTLLPEQTIAAEPAEVTRPRTNSNTVLYLLQAGSFRQRDDADRRRAELLLLGLDPTVEETSGDNGRWYRVYVGPFDSRSKMAKARSLTAGQNIDTLLLKRGKP